MRYSWVHCTLGVIAGLLLYLFYKFLVIDFLKLSIAILSIFLTYEYVTYAIKKDKIHVDLMECFLAFIFSFLFFIAIDIIFSLAIKYLKILTSMVLIVT